MVLKKKVTVSVTIEEKTNKTISAIAKEMRLSKSLLVDLIIKHYLEEHEELRCFADGQEEQA